MKNLYFALILIFILINTSLGQITYRPSNLSNKIYISIKKEIPKPPVFEPPILEISKLAFSDGKEGNRKIDADESTELQFELKNSGMGIGKGLSLSVKETNGLQGLEFESTKRIKDLKSGESIGIILPIKGTKKLQEGAALFEIKVIESNNFGTEVFPIKVETQAFRSPNLKIVDYQSDSIIKMRPFIIKVMVQNSGLGNASAVKLNMNTPQNVNCLSGNESFLIGSLKPGENKPISYRMITTINYNQNTIPLEFKFSEKYNQYFENRTISLPMFQKGSIDTIIVDALDEDQVQPKMQGPIFGSDVDRDIPYLGRKFENKIALIIGNEIYTSIDNPMSNVPYAIRDAEVFGKYVLNTLGLKSENIFIVRNATLGNLNRAISRVADLVKLLGPETELIFYYAGHGSALDTKESCLMPTDANESDLSQAIPLNKIYRKFGDTGAKKITIILDACFSGGARDQSQLADRGPKIKPKVEDISGNMIVFAAAAGDQSAQSLKKEEHGLFTYYLLKKLKDSKGIVTYGELATYLSEKVRLEANRQYMKPQDPNVTPSPTFQGNWEKASF